MTPPRDAGPGGASPDEETRRILAARRAAGGVPLETTKPDEARRQAREDLVEVRPATPVASVDDGRVAGPDGPIPIRIYRPDGPSRAPLTTFFHGGGFVVCDLDTHDALCRRLCRESGTVVVSVAYRRAPEARFPAAVDDAVAATRWAVAQARNLGADPARVVVAGDSAGGNLAAVTALRLRDEAGPALAGQLLLYPVTDHYGAGHASYRSYGDGYGLTAAAMRWFWDHYLPERTRAAHPWASPLRASELGRTPPALVVTAGCDPLRDEGIAYAQRLARAGVPVDHHLFAGNIHGFVTGPEPTSGQDRAFAIMRDWLARLARSAAREGEQEADAPG